MLQLSDLLHWRSTRRLTTLARRSNEEWIEAIRRGPSSETFDELRLLLLRALSIGLRTSSYRLTADDLEDFVQESIVRIVQNIDDFRGGSRFSTWAQKIAMRDALAELRRKRWKDVSLDELMESQSDSDQSMTSDAIAPDELLRRGMVGELVMTMMRTELSERQREALTVVMMHGLPLEEVARQMGTNRNALYKLLHDARLRLQRAIVKSGIDPDDLISKM